MFRACRRAAGQSNRYIDGSGRKLDGMELPTALYQYPMSQHHYPAKTDAWHPVIAGQPTPFKGRIVVVGGGVIGLITTMMFSLRGWHVTLLEKEADPTREPYPMLDTALLSLRGMDVLHQCGISKNIAAARFGARVTGIHEHDSSINTWLTTGLDESITFPVNQLCVNLYEMRKYLLESLRTLKYPNIKIFHHHTLAALFTDRKTAVVKPLRDFERHATETETAFNPADVYKSHNPEWALALNPDIKWEDNVEGIDYDLLIGADGPLSATRQLAEIDVKLTDNSWHQFWFRVEGSPLDPNVMHRWAHKPPAVVADDVFTTDGALPYVVAMPRRDANGCFHVVAYMPRCMMANANGNGVEAFRQQYCPQLGGTVVGTTPMHSKPSAFCMHLINGVTGFPNVALVGDAAHSTHHFLNEGLNSALEDVAYLVERVDRQDQTMWNSVRQYSRERGFETDCLRKITERSMYYTYMKHRNPFLKARVQYGKFMHYACPRSVNHAIEGSFNFVFPRPLPMMLQGRGYVSYEQVDITQESNNRWCYLTRLYA